MQLSSGSKIQTVEEKFLISPKECTRMDRIRNDKTQRELEIYSIQDKMKIYIYMYREREREPGVWTICREWMTKDFQSKQHFTVH
jgi:hypothetical protein